MPNSTHYSRSHKQCWGGSLKLDVLKRKPMLFDSPRGINCIFADGHPGIYLGGQGININK